MADGPFFYSHFTVLHSMVQGSAIQTIRAVFENNNRTDDVWTIFVTQGQLFITSLGCAQTNNEHSSVHTNSRERERCQFGGLFGP